MISSAIIPPPRRLKSGEWFEQVLQLREDGTKVIAQARWICPVDIAQGVVQLLELRVMPGHARQGYGRSLMEMLTQQAKEHFKLNGSKLRRIWLALEQEGQVVARSFLMKFGFHHVGTVHELLKKEDLLIYMRTFD